MSHSAPHHYRPDIDGLRALAVMPVLLYHADVPGFGGGYIGVDIFFVISGFLITGIIAREIDAGEFSVLRFYERRARRILPALIAMIGAVLIAASWLFLPSDFQNVAPSALAALFFLANVWLFTQTGYFQADAEVTPLLHTWSLGVEEQFYIGVPIALLLIARFLPQWRTGAIAAMAVISFVWALATQADTDGFAFYMLPTRAWELFAGSLLALGAVRAVRSQWVRETAAGAGIALIAAATFFYDENTVFPGLAALPPVIGAAALIHCAPGTMVGRLLSLKGPIALGLISYSLYLWHWPLIVFWRYSLEGSLTALDSAAIIALSLVIGWASWRFIEEPFRDRSVFPARRVWSWSAAGLSVGAAASLGLLFQGGWASRFDETTMRYARAASDYSPARATCIADRIADHPDECTLGAEVEPVAMIWGDSHAVEPAWVLGESHGARGEAIAQRTRGSCPPALGFESARDPRCSQFNAHVIEEIAQSPSIRRVYLAGYWEQEPYRRAGIDILLDDTITRLLALDREVVLIGPTPAQPASVPRLLALRGKNAASLPAATFFERTAFFTRHYPDWRARGVVVVDTRKTLAEGNRTIILAGDDPLYYDDNHLSLAGARRVLGAIGD